LEAFSDLGVKRIALIGPYLKEVFDAEVRFFKHHGIETLYLKAMEYRYVKDISSLYERPYVYYRMAKEAYRSVKNIDAIFITCMASPALKIIDVLEQETGVYVLSSISASLYGVMKKLGIKGPIQNYGKVFDRL
jgi:maleate isomerase